MKSEALSPEEYVQGLPESRKEVIKRLREVIKKNLPGGFKETMEYGMIGYVVPLSLYPRGYLQNRNVPLPFMNLASQKNHIAVYHMGIYADKNLLKWFENKYKETYGKKLDTGKSCIRFKDVDTIPYDLIGELAARITTDEWIRRYESMRVPSRRKE
ncbi:MAG: DUF1801 domain-containing protein [Spirochaetales bacterium]|nr:DUF1801 domain-containing protein [Spirochaetales bacterium]